MKKVNVVLVIGILLIGGVIAAISFGFWQLNFAQQDNNLVKMKCFELTFHDETDGIQLLKAIPITDQEGRKLTPYTFTITNVCNDMASYQVNLENVLHDKKVLPLSYVKVELDQNTPNILTNHTEVEPYLEEASDAYKLTTGTLKGNESITYDLRLWVDEDTPGGEETSGASFLSKITIVATPEVEDNLQNEIEILVDLDPFNEVEQKQSIRVDVTSKNHSLIAYVFSNNKLTEEELKSVSWNTIVPESKTHSTTNEYEDNGVYYVYYKDEKGNIEEKEIDINSFDREGPEIIEMSTSDEWGIENTITVRAQDVRSGIIGYAFVSGDSEPSDYITVDGGHEEKTFTHTVRENGTYTIWLKDSLGNISHKSIEVIKIDKINPSITFGIHSQTEGNNGWYKDLSIKVQLSDNESGIQSSKYCVTTESSCEPNIDASINNNEYSVSLANQTSRQKICSIVTDNAGNSSGVVCSDTYGIDNTTPTVAFSINSQTGGNNGWYKNLSLKVTLSDNESGIQSSKYCITTGTTCTPNIDASVNNNEYNVSFDGNGSAQKVCSTVTDSVGNTSSVQCSSAFYVDIVSPFVRSATVLRDGNSINIQVNAHDDHSKIKTYYYSKDSVNWVSSTSDMYTFTNLIDGSYTIYFKVEDTAGWMSDVTDHSVCIAYENVYISSSGNDGACGSSSAPLATIQAGYNNVKNGGVINLLSDIVLNNQLSFNVQNKSVTLQNVGSTHHTISRGNGFTLGDMLYVNAGNKVLISSLTFDGKNVAARGTLLHVEDFNSSLTLYDTYIQNSNNTNNTGGGIIVTSGSTLYANNSLIQNNRSLQEGAGIFSSGANINLVDTSIIGNKTVSATYHGFGGGIYSYEDTTFTMQGGAIQSNQSYNGAGVTFSNTKNISIKDAEISNNYARGRGGAVHITGSNALGNFNNVKITSNIADIYTGGVVVNDKAQITLTNCSFTNNFAKSTIGALEVNGATCILNSGIINANLCNTTNCVGGVDIVGSSIFTNNGCSITGNTNKNINYR